MRHRPDPEHPVDPVALLGREALGESVYVEPFPELVKTLREERGMTKRDLAAAAGISTTTARTAERGAPVRSKTARKLARALVVDPPQRLGRPAHRP